MRVACDFWIISFALACKRTLASTPGEKSTSNGSLSYCVALTVA